MQPEPTPALAAVFLSTFLLAAGDSRAATDAYTGCSANDNRSSYYAVEYTALPQGTVMLTFTRGDPRPCSTRRGAWSPTAESWPGSPPRRDTPYNP